MGIWLKRYRPLKHPCAPPNHRKGEPNQTCPQASPPAGPVPYSQFKTDKIQNQWQHRPSDLPGSNAGYTQGTPPVWPKSRPTKGRPVKPKRGLSHPASHPNPYQAGGRNPWCRVHQQRKQR